MAEDAVADSEDLEEQGEEGQKKGKPVVLIALLAVLLIAGAGAGAYFMLGSDTIESAETAVEGDEAGSDEESASETVVREAYYFSLDPAFIVNFAGKSRARFLQVNIDGLTREAGVKEDVTKHFPQIRNNIVLLLSSKTYDELIMPEGKEALRKEVLKEIQKILETETGKQGVEDVYFTSFVMQ